LKVRDRKLQVTGTAEECRSPKQEILPNLVHPMQKNMENDVPEHFRSYKIVSGPRLCGAQGGQAPGHSRIKCYASLMMLPSFDVQEQSIQLRLLTPKYIPCVLHLEKQ